MILLADNDIIFKLARCDLYDGFLGAFEVTTDEVFILNTCRFVLTSDRAEKRCDEASFARLREFLDSVNDIEQAPDANEMVALAEQPRIDAGEAVLFSICPAVPNSVLASGDKRSLCSLTEAAVSDAVCASVCNKLTGKVVCFEQIIGRVIDHQGFDAVRDRLIVGRECDKTLAIVLGGGLDATEESVREGLASYIGDLRRTTGGLLVP
ncbi:MAG TPA: hypothetical protein VFW33_08250 [Gemmataceae bacterium]|nr:hypothetical protein [Gemmataceae bacterium]